jgi:hypothetical protein
VRGTGSQQHAGHAAADAAGAGQQPGFTVRHMEQLVRAHLLLSQVGGVCCKAGGVDLVAPAPALYGKLVACLCIFAEADDNALVLCCQCPPPCDMCGIGTLFVLLCRLHQQQRTGSPMY